MTTGVPDTTAPTAPSGLRLAGITPTQAILRWTAAQDNVGVAGYDVWTTDARCMPWKVTVPATATTATVVFPVPFTGGTISFYVKAFDAAGNVSAQSNLVSFAAEPPVSPSATTGTSPRG